MPCRRVFCGIALTCSTVARCCWSITSRSDHLLGKPENVWEFDSYQGNVREFGNSQGIPREKILLGKACLRMWMVYNFIINCIAELLWIFELCIYSLWACQHLLCNHCKYQYSTWIMPCYEQHLTYRGVPQILGKCTSRSRGTFSQHLGLGELWNISVSISGGKSGKVSSQTGSQTSQSRTSTFRLRPWQNVREFLVRVITPTSSAAVQTGQVV